MQFCGETVFSISVFLNLTIRKCSPSRHCGIPTRRLNTKLKVETEGMKTAMKPPVFLGSTNPDHLTELVHAAVEVLSRSLSADRKCILLGSGKQNGLMNGAQA